MKKLIASKNKEVTQRTKRHHTGAALSPVTTTFNATFKTFVRGPKTLIPSDLETYQGTIPHFLTIVGLEKSGDALVFDLQENGHIKVVLTEKLSKERTVFKKFSSYDTIMGLVQNSPIYNLIFYHIPQHKEETHIAELVLTQGAAEVHQIYGTSTIAGKDTLQFLNHFINDILKIPALLHDASMVKLSDDIPLSLKLLKSFQGATFYENFGYKPLNFCEQESVEYGIISQSSLLHRKSLAFMKDLKLFYVLSFIRATHKNNYKLNKSIKAFNRLIVNFGLNESSTLSDFFKIHMSNIRRVSEALSIDSLHNSHLTPVIDTTQFVEDMKMLLYSCLVNYPDLKTDTPELKAFNLALDIAQKYIFFEKSASKGSIETFGIAEPEKYQNFTLPELVKLLETNYKTTLRTWSSFTEYKELLYDICGQKNAKKVKL